MKIEIGDLFSICDGLSTGVHCHKNREKQRFICHNDCLFLINIRHDKNRENISYWSVLLDGSVWILVVDKRDPFVGDAFEAYEKITM